MTKFKFRLLPIIFLLFVSCLGYYLNFGLIVIKANILDKIAYVDSYELRMLFHLLGLYVAIQLIAIVANIISNNGRNFFAVKEFKRVWYFFSPSIIKSKYFDRSSSYYNAVYNNFPKLYDLKLSVANQVWFIISVLIVFLWKMWENQFWIALIFIPITVLSSYIAAMFYAKKYAESIGKISQNKVNTMTWLNIFFKGFRELYLNYKVGVGKNDDRFSWFRKQGDVVTKQLWTHSKLELKRELISTLFVDVPPMACVVTVLVIGIYQKLSIGDIFIWLTLIDYLVSASVSINNIKTSRYEIKKLEELIEDDLNYLKLEIEENEGNSDDCVQSINISNNLNFKLLDGHDVKLSAEPGLYQVRGSNGSGKTTLLDAICGLNTEYDTWDKDAIRRINSKMKNRTRIIEADPAIFPNLDSFEDQILLNMNTEGKTWQEKFHDTCASILPHEIAVLWEEKLQSLENLWKLRGGSLSKGEKIIFSLARTFVSWDENVRFLICDEIDSALDDKTRALLRKTIIILSKSIAVYFVSHVYWSNQVRGTNKNSFYTTIGLIGHIKAKDEAVVLPTSIIGKTGGNGTITGTGEIGKKLADQIKIIRTALIHTSQQYSILHEVDFHIDMSEEHNFSIGQTYSSGLAIAIGIINIYRAILGKSTHQDIAATGKILLNGNIIPVEKIEKKTEAAINTFWIKRIITPDDVTQLADLERVVYQ